MTYTLPASWQPLKAHSATMASTSMLDLFADNPDRAAEFSLDAAGLTLDYSKNLVDARTLALLGQLYAECQLGSGIEAMFNGVRVNNTEDRAALHTLLRAPKAAATGPLAKEYAEVQASLQSVKRISEAVRAGQWLGCTGKPITHILHLGIGGSYLGPRMVDEALSAYADAGIHCDYVANVDGQHIDQVLKRLDQATTLVIIVSKSFATVETRVNAQSAQDWLQQAVPLAQRHLHAVAVTSNVAAAKDFGIAAENILPMWDWVGGRYSLWSAVSLPIAIKYGFARFEALLAGAASMDEHFRSAAWPNNMPMLLAAIGVLYRNFMNIGSHAILPSTIPCACCQHTCSSWTWSPMASRSRPRETWCHCRPAPSSGAAKGPTASMLFTSCCTRAAASQALILSCRCSPTTNARNITTGWWLTA
jgi:glucose-6-phosphate isomerase